MGDPAHPVNPSSVTGAALVVGGGVAGMQAALDLADGGFRVYLVDSAPAIGGTAARLDKIFPTNDCSMCMLSPRLAECSRHLNVEIIANAELLELSGQPGRFTAHVRQRARYVDLDRCTACGDCAPVCPVVRPDAFNGGLSQRRAIYKLYPQGTPNAFVVERTGTAPCRHACPAGVRGSALAALIREGRHADALEVLLEDNPFPGVCAHVCGRLCEAACPRHQVDQPVALAALARYLAGSERRSGEVSHPRTASPRAGSGRGVMSESPEDTLARAGPKSDSSGKRVAVVGAGPAGLTAAADLARLGYRVVVFEAGPAAGGALRALYPEQALAGGLLDREIAAVTALGVEVRVNSPVPDPPALLQDGYAAVVVATGRSVGEEAAGSAGPEPSPGLAQLGWPPARGEADLPLPVGEGRGEGTPLLFAVDFAPTVPEAIGAGHRAARAVHGCLQGEAAASPSPHAERGPGGEGGLPVVALSPAEVQAALGAGLASRRPSVLRPLGAERTLSGEAPLTVDEALAEAERCLACGGCAECGQCLRVCQADAVDLAMPDRELELEVGAVVLAMGIEPFDPQVKGEYGYGRYPNVLTSLQFERMLSASGPSGGRLYRPSDGWTPLRIAFVQCVGSRDSASGRGYCSEICCMFVAEEAIVAREHEREVEPTVFCLDVRATGKGFERHVESARREHGVRYVRSMVSSIREVPGSRNLRVRYADEGGQQVEEEFDLVVLATGLGTPESARQLCARLGVELDEYGFPRPSGASPTSTSREGVFAAGCFAGPKDISASMVEGSAAASEVARLLAPARGTSTRQKEYPPERDVSEEPARVGVFVCRCGINIGGVVDAPAVADYARRLPDVAHAEENLYTCSQDTLSRMGAKIEEQGLNRVVVAACTPRTHEPLYRETIREAGLNPYLFEMVNIREQDSWVHRGEPALATRKAQGLVGMAVARAVRLRPISRRRFDVVAEALVLGGGLAGTTAALALADQGFRTCLVEREAELGGNLRRLRYSLGRVQPQSLLRDLEACAHSHPAIRVCTRATLKEFGGRVGRFTSVLRVGGDTPEELTITHGTLIVAVGAQTARPEGYLYGEDPRVVTQAELEEMLAEVAVGTRRPSPSAHGEGHQGGESTLRSLQGKGSLGLGHLRRVVMIQCVGSRTADRPYCSKVCCPQAVKNALELRALAPEGEVYVLFRELRTGGLLEDAYRLAREAGVRFLRYDADRPPEVRRAADGLEVVVEVTGRRRKLGLAADLVVLSAGIAPGEHADLAARLKLPLTDDGFFLEAHPKLRPIDFAADGVFLCGLAHSPQTIPDVIAQAKGAAARAATLLSREALESTGAVAVVDERRCTGCGLCVSACAYEARRLDEESRVALVEEVLCQGCGACAAACPSGATRQLTLERRQMLAMLEAV